jgi:hypothetical protein
MSDKKPKLSDDERKNVLRQIISIPTENLPDVLENQKDNKEIVTMIKQEMKERENGLKRIPMFEEAVALYGSP